VRRIAPLAGIAGWVKVPDLEFYQLKAETKVQGEIAGQAVTGGTFWAIPEASNATPGSYREIGNGQCEGLAGPMALELKVGTGRVIVALTALDTAGVLALLRGL
jgi:hypothetical protein